MKAQAILVVLLTVAWAPCAAQEDFRRGDANVDGKVDIADAEAIRMGIPAADLLPCPAAADTDEGPFGFGRGRLDVIDVIYLLTYLYSGGSAPRDPGPDEPGPDPETDQLPCPSYSPPDRPPVLADVSFGFECAGSIPGSPGDTITFDVFVTLTTQNSTAQLGPQGWSFGIVAENGTIQTITTDGTDVELFFGGGFSQQRETVGAGNEGAVSVVFLRIERPADVPIEGQLTIARIEVETTIPAESTSTPVTLRFRESLVGPGQPVPIVVSIDGVSHRPVTESHTCIVGDCNGNGESDAEDIALGRSADCDGNGTPDECDPDCNGNGIPDTCDLLDGTSADCNQNGLPDECDIAAGTVPDCNQNGVPDACDFRAGTLQDCNADGLPDECEPPGEDWEDLCFENIGVIGRWALSGRRVVFTDDAQVLHVHDFVTAETTNLEVSVGFFLTAGPLVAYRRAEMDASTVEVLNLESGETTEFTEFAFPSEVSDSDLSYLRLSETWLVARRSESQRDEDFTGDGDKGDRVLAVGNLATGETTRIDMAVHSFELQGHWLRFLAVERGGGKT